MSAAPSLTNAMSFLAGAAASAKNGVATLQLRDLYGILTDMSVVQNYLDSTSPGTQATAAGAAAAGANAAPIDPSTFLADLAAKVQAQNQAQMDAALAKYQKLLQDATAAAAATPPKPGS